MKKKRVGEMWAVLYPGERNLHYAVSLHRSRKQARAARKGIQTVARVHVRAFGRG